MQWLLLNLHTCNSSSYKNSLQEFIHNNYYYEANTKPMWLRTFLFPLGRSPHSVPPQSQEPHGLHHDDLCPLQHGHTHPQNSSRRQPQDTPHLVSRDEPSLVLMLAVFLCSWLVTHLGGFFIKRKLDTAAGKDILYRKCLQEVGCHSCPHLEIYYCIVGSCGYKFFLC